MPITKSLNSKANFKQFTNNDLPFSPAQPVLNSYIAVSTAGQTSITNLGFSVDTVNNPNAFFLFVDGRKLTQGSTNDFVFAAVAADGTSSQVTFNYALPINLNIQAYKLGLKPEIQFQMDNRFTQLYEAEGQAFQGFVNTTSFINTATSTAGTPAAGTFYSSIVGRAPMVDLSQDLKPRMGVERIMTQQIQMLQNEFGPNGEPVFSTPNDQFGQIRFVGQWSSFDDGSGVRLHTSNINDYLEITFYGTGLNIFHYIDSAQRAYYSTVDGGTESATNIYTTGTSGSGVLGGRNYSANICANVLSGLALGVHTVKIRLATNDLHFYGFEILNQSSNVIVNPGVSYFQGKKLVNSAQSSIAYRANVTGTTGGRVLVYQKADGTIQQAFTPCASAPSYLSAATHANEEIARTYFPREFGAARGDDFSLINSSTVNAAFTLDDGTTTLVGNQVRLYNGGNSGFSDGLGPYVAGGFWEITFVGTGLDVVWGLNQTTGATSDAYTITVDGTNITTTQTVTNVTSTNGIKNQFKICSGLPYGTHTVKFSRNAAANPTIHTYSFIVYQPQKPTLPSGALELADYNVMANYVASAGDTTGPLSTGVLFKSPVREIEYVGTWSTPNIQVQTASGWQLYTSTSGSYYQYTFFGTGIELFGTWNGSTASSGTVQIDGVNYTGAATVSPSANGTWTPSTSTWTISAGLGNQLQISGLALGIHTIRVTAATANPFYLDSLNIITPIYSAKSNLYADIQNTLTVGSNSLSDNRKTSAIKDSLPATKAWAQAVGITASPTTTSLSLVPAPDMSVTVKTSGGVLDISWSLSAYGSSTNMNTTFQIYVDGVAVGPIALIWIPSGGAAGEDSSRRFFVPVSAGVHKVDLFWAVNTGTGTLQAVDRSLTVKEI